MSFVLGGLRGIKLQMFHACVNSKTIINDINILLVCENRTENSIFMRKKILG